MRGAEAARDAERDRKVVREVDVVWDTAVVAVVGRLREWQDEGRDEAAEEDEGVGMFWGNLRREFVRSASIPLLVQTFFVFCLDDEAGS